MAVTTLNERLALRAEELRRRLDPATLPFETTAEVEPLQGTIGQPRALEALEFGLEIETFGFNLYVAGAPGSGRETTVRDYLERAAAERAAPEDWIYLHNFDDPDRPQAIRLPAGRACAFRADMEQLVEAVRDAIPRAFESEDYARRRERALAQVAAQRQVVIERLEAFAHEHGYALQETPGGMVSAPLVDGRPVSPQDLERLTDDERQELERRGEEVKGQAEEGLRELRRLEKEALERTKELDRDMAEVALGPLLDELRERYRDLPELQRYLDEVRDDLPQQLPALREAGGEAQPAPFAQLANMQQGEQLTRYEVNVLVDSSRQEGAPLVIERNPTYYNLVGRVDYRSSFGAMVTDFRQIKPGALHRANGGFLLVHLADLIRQPFAYEALKRCLRSREVCVENIADQYSPVPTATLRPEPIPLELKVVVIGTPLLYQLLHALDEDFRELFKVKVDFAPDMDWSDEHVGNYAAFVSRCVADAGLRHFDRSAVARTVEYSARLREHQGKLSARLLEISDVVAEASFWAGKAGRETVSAADVDTAVAHKDYRSNLLEERSQELLAEGTLAVDLTGERIGQVNGLSIAELGDYQFGRPTRVTARVALGRGSVESIEREIELSGPIHSKGFLILSGYLAGQYGQDWPLALRATLAFEQSYDEIEGDSASSTELYALLSALSRLPLRQGVAVTGSVDQHGNVQAVGGVTRKVEGFFAACRQRDLTGDQGVIVPATNIRHLMLADDVVDAVARGDFHLWGVRTIDEGIELLTGREAGERADDGSYPPDSVHRLVQDRLAGYADRMRAFVSTDGHVTSSSRR